MGFVLIANDAHHRVGLVDDSVVVVFRAGPTSSDVVRGWESALAKRSRRKPAAFFGIVEPDSVPPDELARAAMSRFFEKHHEDLASCAVIVEGAGFRAAVGRAIVTTVMSILPRRRFPFPRHTTSDLAEAVEWARKLTPEIDVQSTLAGIEGLRALK